MPRRLLPAIQASQSLDHGVVIRCLVPLVLTMFEARTGPHESLLMNSVGTVTRWGSCSGLAIRLRTDSTSCFPISSGNSRTELKAGYSHVPMVSPQPATLISLGILSPLSRSAL